MFGKLLLFSRWISLTKQEFLWEKGGDGSKFYFVVTGNLELIVKSQGSDDFKFSKGIDCSTFFGLKEVIEARYDYARVLSEKCEILEIDSQMYKEIVSKT
mmetsp:Transcript_37798/g.57862  ORF Transcript_37798/g.57862 Transcript_37798/m.57862 type:complete len:100 (-) Transcript_37798:1172-1471(-)